MKVKKLNIEETVERLRKQFTRSQLRRTLEHVSRLQKSLEPCTSTSDIKLLGLNTSSGLCFMMDKFFKGRVHPSMVVGGYDLTLICQYSWKHRREDVIEPVKENSRYGRWEGVNLEMRKNLLDHLISCLKLAVDKVGDRYER